MEHSVLRQKHAYAKGPFTGIPRGNGPDPSAQAPGKVLSGTSFSLALSVFKMHRGVLEMVSTVERRESGRQGWSVLIIYLIISIWEQIWLFQVLGCF